MPEETVQGADSKEYRGRERSVVSIVVAERAVIQPKVIAEFYKTLSPKLAVDSHDIFQ